MERSVLSESMMEPEEERSDGPRWADVQQEVSGSVGKQRKTAVLVARLSIMYIPHLRAVCLRTLQVCIHTINMKVELVMESLGMGLGKVGCFCRTRHMPPCLVYRT